MVCLNENISFNIKTLKKNLYSELKTIVDDYDHILNDKLILSLKNNIEKKIKELFHNDHFIYLNMNNNICTFKHKRGSKDGFFCTRKINTNLIDDKKDYLCCRHSKKHIPKKKENKKNNKNDEVKNKSDILKSKSIIKRKNYMEIPKKLYKNCNKINNTLSFKEISLNKYNIKKFNIYKTLLFNSEHKYKTLYKDFSLLDFFVNKIRNKKNKNYINCYNLL